MYHPRWEAYRSGSAKNTKNAVRSAAKKEISRIGERQSFIDSVFNKTDNFFITNLRGYFESFFNENKAIRMEVKSQSRRQQMAEKSVADAGAETPGMSPFRLRIINRLDKGWM